MTTQTHKMTDKHTTTTGSALRRLLWVTPLAMAVSSAANLAVYHAAGIINPSVTAWPGASSGQVIGASVVYLLIGALVAAVVAWRAARPARTYTRIATAGLLLSLAMPLLAGAGFAAPGAPPADGATVVALSLMHVVAYALSVPLFNRLALD